MSEWYYQNKQNQHKMDTKEKEDFKDTVTVTKIIHSKETSIISRRAKAKEKDTVFRKEKEREKDMVFRKEKVSGKEKERVLANNQMGDQEPEQMEGQYSMQNATIVESWDIRKQDALNWDWDSREIARDVEKSDIQKHNVLCRT